MLHYGVNFCFSRGGRAGGGGVAGPAAGRDDRFRDGGREARSAAARRASPPRRTDSRAEWKSERSSLQHSNVSRGDHRGGLKEMDTRPEKYSFPE